MIREASQMTAAASASSSARTQLSLRRAINSFCTPFPPRLTPHGSPYQATGDHRRDGRPRSSHAAPILRSAFPCAALRGNPLKNLPKTKSQIAQAVLHEELG